MVSIRPKYFYKMGWQIGYQITKPAEDIFAKIEELPDMLSEEDAQAFLGEFLSKNLGLFWYFLTSLRLKPFQEIILNGWFKKDRSVVVMARGGGKCIDKNSIVLSDKGFIKIDNIKAGDAVWTKNRFRPVLKKINNPLEDGLIITTRKNFNVTGKFGHKVLTFNKTNALFEYKQIENIKTGDYIPIKFGMNQFFNEDITKGFEMESYKNTNTRFNVINDKDLYYLIGLILGDGTTRTRGTAFSISTEDAYIANFIRKAKHKFFPENNIQRYHKPQNRATDFKISNRFFMKFLQHIGIDIDAKAHEKRLSDKLINTQKEFIKSLIQGLFDSDGCCCIKENKKKNATQGHIEYSSSSLELITQVRRILLNFGVVSKLRLHRAAGNAMVMGQECKIQNNYRLSITSRKFLKKFYDEIGFKLPRKQKLLEYYLEKTSSTRDYDSNIFPIGDILKAKYGASGYRSSGYHKIHSGVSEERLKFLLEKNLLTEEEKNLFEPLLENWVFTQVESIEPCKIETVDIQVQDDECYWSEGLIHHNSFLIAAFSMLYSIVFKNSSIIIVGANFRQVKEIFGYMDKFLKRKGSGLLRQCFGHYSRQPDLYQLSCFNGSVIKGLPMSGEKIRGQRASVLIIDEGLLLSETVHKQVLEPFLSSRLNAEEELATAHREKELVRLGVIKEEDMTIFPPNKMIITSSASYKFEYLYYGIWKPYIDDILDSSKERTKVTPTRFAMRMSASAIEKADSFMDRARLEEIESSVSNDPTSKRENDALFTDASDSYFNVEKLHECTVIDGERPTVKLKGDKDKQYILALDAAYGDNANNDFFAMGVYELEPENRRIYQVHSRGTAGEDIKIHYQYLIYLLQNFNIVWIIIDASGTEFIDGFNESELAKQRGLKLGYIKADFEQENYLQEIKNAKNEWNIETKTIVYPHTQSSHTNRRTNEYLQGGISARKVWFGSKLALHEEDYNKALTFSVPFEFKDSDGEIYTTASLIDAQDDWIAQTKRQLGLIEVKTTSLGTLQYDLPSSVKNSKSANRARKDNYTCLMLAYYASKHVFDLMFTPKDEAPIGFTPFLC